MYLEHLTVALHSHSFIFFAFMLVQIFDYLSGAFGSDYAFLSSMSEYIVIGLLIWMPIYIFIMQKRVYKQGYLLTTLKFSLIGFSYLMLITFTFVAAMIWGVADMPFIVSITFDFFSGIKKQPIKGCFFWIIKSAID